MVIPTLFSHNHAAQVVRLSNGDLLCAWFGGSCEGKPDISIHCSRLKAEETQWSTPELLSDDMSRSEQNPILFEKEPGHLWLIYTAQLGIQQDTALVRWRQSYDYGYTWTLSKDMFDTTGLFVRHPPVQLQNGVILLPAYYCRPSTSGFLGEDYSVIKRSEDGGASWSEVEIPKSIGLVHMSLVLVDSKNLVGFFRSRQADFIYKTVSQDNGKTWSVPVATELPNNNSSLQCTVLQSGRLAIVYNHVNKYIAPPKVQSPPWFDTEDMKHIAETSTGNPKKNPAVWGVKRNPLVLATSEDRGATWKIVKELSVSAHVEDAEFSYPSICQGTDGILHIAYTYMRKHIEYIRFLHI